MAKDEMIVPEPVSIVGLRTEMRRILEAAHYFGRRYMIMRNGEPIAVLVGLEDFRRLIGAPGATAEIDQE
jgi:antitoxin (DNA-binding transcriptional repressor) of toxin-antitoxin stability system